MKKSVITLVVVAIFFSLCSCSKEYKNHHDALSYLWNEVQDGSERPHGKETIFTQDSIFEFYATMNYIPKWNRETLLVRLTTNDSTFDFWAENSSGYWYIEDDDTRSDDQGYNLRSIIPEEERLLRAAYNAYMKN